VFGTVSTEAKAALARSAGADEVIFYTQQDFEVEVKRLSGGRGVDVIYDSVGVSTFLKGLNCIRPRGMMVLFGQSSGPVAPLDPGILNTKGSLFLTRPSLAHHCATREELLWRAGMDRFRPAEIADRSHLQIGRRRAGASRSGKPRHRGKAAAPTRLMMLP
jgi:NADPH2:quinone reductase